MNKVYVTQKARLILRLKDARHLSSKLSLIWYMKTNEAQLVTMERSTVIMVCETVQTRKPRCGCTYYHILSGDRFMQETDSHQAEFIFNSHS